MSSVNPELLRLAQTRIWRQKQAFVPPGGGGDPAAAGGGAPAGAPPGAPPAAPPSGDPAAMGGGGGAPMMPPGMMSGPSQQMGAMMGTPMAQPMPGGAGEGKKPKFDPLMLDYRMYNIQQQITAMMNALNIQLPPDALVMPPGAMGAPPAEAAMPGMGGPVDQATQAAGGGAAAPPGGAPPGGGGAPPMDPAAMGGAPPGGAPKMAAARTLSVSVLDEPRVSAALADDEKAASYIGDPINPGDGIAQSQAAAIAAVYRSRMAGARYASAAA